MMVFACLRSFADSLQWLLNLIGIAGYFWMAYAFLAARSRYIRRRRLLEVVPSEGAVAVAIGVGTQLEGDVQSYLARKFGPNSLPLVRTIFRPGFISKYHFADVVSEIKGDLSELMARGGIRQVHLFYAGPCSIATAIGAIVHNWVAVHLYQRNTKTGDYDLVLTLDEETVKGS